MKTHFYTNEIIKICDNNHLTVDEIFEILSKKFPNAWKSSVYRNVEELSQKWELKKVIWAWKKTFFEKTKKEHIHLIDTESWKILDLDIDITSWLNLPVWFKIDEMDVKIFWKFK